MDNQEMKTTAEEDRVPQPEQKPSRFRRLGSLWKGLLVGAGLLAIVPQIVGNYFLNNQNKVQQTNNELTSIVEHVTPQIADTDERLQTTAEAFRALASPQASAVVDSALARSRSGRTVLTPVKMPLDSVERDTVLKRLEKRIAQDSLPSRLVDVAISNRPEPLALTIRILTNVVDSLHVRTISGAVVNREDVGGLWRDRNGRMHCIGPCGKGQVCCQLAPTGSKP